MRVTLFYLAFGVAWILLSDALLLALVSDPHLLTVIQNIKGILFVALSAILITLLVRWDEAARRRAARDLQRSEERFNTYFRLSPAATCITTLDTGEFVDANDHFLRLVGYARDELIGHTTVELNFWDKPADRVFLVEELQAHPQVRERPVTCRTKTGELRPVIGSSDLIELDGRQCMLTTILDVFERRQAEEALRQSQARFERMVANVPGMVYRFVLHQDGTSEFTYVSPGCRDFFELEPEQIMANQAMITDLIHPEDRIVFERTVAQSNRNITPWHWEGRYILASGLEKWGRIASRPERLSNGDVAWDGVLLNITEGKRAEAHLRASEERFRTHFQEMPLAACMWQKVGDDFVLINYNHAADALTQGNISQSAGRTAREMYGKHMPEVLERLSRCYTDHMAIHHEIRYRFRFTEIEKDLAVSYGFVPPDFVVVYNEDITERKEAEAALRASEDHFRSLIENSLDMIAIVDLEGHILYQGPSSQRVIGYAPEEIQGRNAFDLIHKSDQQHLRDVLLYAAQHPGTTHKAEFRTQHKDGSWRYCEALGKLLNGSTSLSARPGNHASTAHDGANGHDNGHDNGHSSSATPGGDIRIVVNTRDITERKEAEARLTRGAFFDELTSLSNRVRFLDHLGQSLARQERRPESEFAVLFLDLDRFKNINDSLGHANGDLLLVQVAERLSRGLRPEDTCARLGGDEFAILLDGVRGVAEATQVAGRIQEVLAEPFDLDRHEVFVQASIGIVMGGSHLAGRQYERAEEILRDADTAMYRAKSGGKARYEVFDVAMHTQVLARLQLENSLRRAIQVAATAAPGEATEFQLHYQPIIDLKTGRMAAVEALARWQHPEKGMVSPGEFIPIAEETGLIVPLGLWVLRTACLQMRRWIEEFNLSCADNDCLNISVNVSSKQFSQPDLDAQVERVLQECDLSACCLKLEITESVLMENSESAATLLRRFKEMGIQLLMDDFGTGYSSLSYLHRFSLDTLKIDRSFVLNLREDGTPGQKNSLEIVRTIINMAADLEMRAIAEGIETARQLDQLIQLGCTLGQGYLFAKPLDAAAMKAFIARDMAERGTAPPHATSPRKDP